MRWEKFCFSDFILFYTSCIGSKHLNILDWKTSLIMSLFLSHKTGGNVVMQKCCCRASSVGSTFLSHPQRPGIRHRNWRHSGLPLFYFALSITFSLWENETGWPMATGEANLWLIGISLLIMDVSWGAPQISRKCQNIGKLWVNRLIHFGANLLRTEAGVSICPDRLHW